MKGEKGEGKGPHPAYADPVYRISKLASSARKPLSVSPDTKLQEVVTHMLTNDFSQLPVMTSGRDVKGIITWASIGKEGYRGAK